MAVGIVSGQWNSAWDMKVFAAADSMDCDHSDTTTDHMEVGKYDEE